MASLARDDVQHGGFYILSFCELVHSENDGWCVRNGAAGDYAVDTDANWQGPHLEPGEGPIKVKLVKDEGDGE